MFTGLVEGRGTVREIWSEGAAIRLTIEAPDELTDDRVVGASVAINGCCLTLVEVDGDRWMFQAGEETISKTNLGELQPGHQVNLERSLCADGRFGGHFVQGHVDGVGYVDGIQRDGEWVTMWFRVLEHLATQLVPKGSVAIDGVSLTVAAIERDRFSVALIPHTLQMTILGIRSQGDAVNIETDIIGKYVQKFVDARAAE